MKYSFLKLLVLSMTLTILGFVLQFYLVQSQLVFTKTIVSVFSLLSLLLIVFMGVKFFNIQLVHESRIKWEEIKNGAMLTSGVIIFNLVVMTAFVDRDSFVAHSMNLPKIDLLFYLAISVAPLVEELFYRKLVCDLLVKNYSVLNTILLSAIIFSLAHVFTGTNLWYSFSGGIVLAFLYLKSRKLVLSIIMHIFINIVTFPLLYAIGYSLKNSTIVNNNFYFLYWLVIIISSLLAYFGYSRLNASTES